MEQFLKRPIEDPMHCLFIAAGVRGMDTVRFSGSRKSQNVRMKGSYSEFFEGLSEWRGEMRLIMKRFLLHLHNSLIRFSLPFFTFCIFPSSFISLSIVDVLDFENPVSLTISDWSMLPPADSSS